MSDFSHVTNNTGGDSDRNTTDSENHSTAFAAALIKAQQIAAKIKPDSSSQGQAPPSLPVPAAGIKRPIEDDFGGPQESKRPSFGGNMDPGMAMGGVTSEQVMVPDKMVGMIIGRGGEQITRLQAESGCKIQMAQESGGLSERMCTLTGPHQSIAHAKSLIEAIIAQEGQGGRGGFTGGPMGGGGVGGGQMEMMVPGHKVGLIIGKGGETIKMLQEQTGAKIIIIQESNEHAEQKPLRISGSPEAIEEAKSKVMEILNQHDMGGGFGGRGRGRGGPGRGGPGMMRGGFAGRGRGGGAGWPTGGPDSGDSKTEYIMVPASKVGLVIGKGGETIKSINQASGAHTEIDKTAPPDANEKNFIIRGPAECVEKAKQMVMEKIGLIQGTGYGSFPGQTFNPNAGSRGGGPGEYYHQGQGGHPGQPAMNPATGQPDYSAQWAEYYRSMGMTKQAEMIEQQQQGAAGVPASSSPATSSAAPQGASQPDYSAQWAEYYRSIGKMKEAEQIEAQIRAKGSGAGPTPASAPQPQFVPAGQPGYQQPAVSQAYYQPQQGGYPGYE